MLCRSVSFIVVWSRVVLCDVFLLMHGSPAAQYNADSRCFKFLDGLPRYFHRWVRWV